MASFRTIDRATGQSGRRLVLRKFLDFVIYNLATGLGTGLAPVASGTFGSLWGLLLVYILHRFQPSAGFYLLVVVVGFAVAVYVSGWVAEAEDQKDPSIVVADEIIGQMVVFLFIPPAAVSLSILIAGFLLFRIFDIWKPWPIRRLEALPGGFGIVLDDMLAGVYANIILQIWLRY